VTSPPGISLSLLPPHPCGYLPGREAQVRGFLTRALAPANYEELLASGFRRSGTLVYQPACAGCAECRSLRIGVERFRASASQRRCWRKNSDLAVTVGKTSATGEKFDLYARYVIARHGRPEDATPQAFVSFLYDSPLPTLEMEYREAGGKLLAVGICDRVGLSLSSVYFYYDPAEMRRGLGTYGVLWELEYARREGLKHYYLGYWISGCATMQYKSDFGPHELLDADGGWREKSPAPSG
jgi:arginine-tRNA-protein transferase